MDTQHCRFCLDQNSILTYETCCTGCSALVNQKEQKEISERCLDGLVKQAQELNLYYP